MNGPRVAIVGAGVMGRWHAHAARRIGARVVAVADVDRARARSLGGPDVETATVEEALKRNPDVVHVCTPFETHSEICRMALAVGSHVIVEKPVTSDPEEATALQREARRRQRQVIPVHQFVFQDGVSKIVSKKARLGPLRLVEFATCSAGAERLPDRDRDSVAAEIAPHAFSLARRILGEAVGELEWELSRPAPGEWHFGAVAPSGCAVRGMISLASRPTFATCRVLGERGSALADLFHGHAIFEPGTASRSYKVIRPVFLGLRSAGASAAQLLGRAARGEAAYPGLRQLLRASYASIAGVAPPPFRDDEIVDVTTGCHRLRVLSGQQT